MTKKREEMEGLEKGWRTKRRLSYGKKSDEKGKKTNR